MAGTGCQDKMADTKPPGMKTDDGILVIFRYDTAVFDTSSILVSDLKSYGTGDILHEVAPFREKDGIVL
jgi:hypothetical protein